ncbi:MAG: NifB/NifX family molybdenum-iron cluster-binding protein [Atopobiaceae bacterium]|nr:NifB/NifX family molybdenum-iron cluster-binding protein [Atopobiaceae bacterium]
MRVVIPCEDYQGLSSLRSGHFGHAPWLTVVDLDDEQQIVAIHAIKNAEHGEGGCGNVISYVLGLEANAIIAAGMGMRPLMAFTQNGVNVYVDREVPLVGDVLARFLAGSVDQMNPDDACQH